MKEAADILRGGGVVAIPTETVYGLAADATNAEAVRRIFEIKGRPATNPLIVHVADVEGARACVAEWPDEATRLAERFWPGPLTIVLPKAASIVDEVTAGGPTVGVRVPDHPVTLEVIRDLGRGVCAPSANRSEHVSPTTAQHVRDDLGNSVDLILDGGPCRVGIESTVLSLATPVPTALRPGGVSLEALQEVLGEVRVQAGSDKGVAMSPGRQGRHYAPDLHVRSMPHGDPSSLSAVALEEGWNNFVVMPLAHGRVAEAVDRWSGGEAIIIAMPADPKAYACQLYDALREAERLGNSTDTGYLFIELPPATPEWAAVRDRILRATAEADLPR